MIQTFVLTTSQIEHIMKIYHTSSISLTNPYMLFRAKINNTTLTIFKTNKMTLQGSDLSLIIDELDLEPIKIEPKPKFEPSFHLSIIGTDEVGTGDYFGGITVCACFVPKDKLILLMKLGVRDSKKIKDDKIIALAPKLMSEVNYSILLLSNEKYNEITKMPNANLNKIKAVMHNKVISKLLTQSIAFDAIFIDAFTTKDKYFSYLKGQPTMIKNVELVEKGEEKHLAIAAASIIARYHFIKNIQDLSEKYNYDLPKGAGLIVDNVLAKIIKDKNASILPYIAKVNFKNTVKVNALLQRNE